MSSSLQALLVVAFLSAGVPFAARPLRGRVPTIILYLISGIVVGPALLGWIQPDPAMDLLRKLALAAVFAVIGYEFNLRDLTGVQESFQLVLLLSVGLLSLCVVLGVDILLGGLLVGFVLRRYLPDPNQAPVICHFNAVIDGFLAPLFLILAGSRINIVSTLLEAASIWPPALSLLPARLPVAVDFDRSDPDGG
jgi:Kef-type K+ transport system membrane component KefB